MYIASSGADDKLQMDGLSSLANALFPDPRQRAQAEMVIEGEYEEVPPSGPGATDGAPRGPLLDSSGNIVPKRD